MLIKLTFALVLAFSCVSPLIPQQSQSDAQLRTATLLAGGKTASEDDYARSAISFRFGINGDEAVAITKNKWDLFFGGVETESNTNWFTVTQAGDRSRIRDLGAFDWSNEPVLLPLPPCEGDYLSCTGVRLTFEGGKLVSTSSNLARAIPGHMYLVHTKNGSSDFYTLFRVEQLRPKESCTIKWRIVPAPQFDEVRPEMMSLGK